MEDTIERRLDERGVPGVGVTWSRIQEYAENYSKYAIVLVNDDPLNSLGEDTNLPLSKDQEKAWKRLAVWSYNSEPYFVLRGYAGVGKEQPLWCKVHTEDGPINLGDVHIGTRIYGQNGQLTTVTGVYPQGIKRYYKVTFRDGVSTYCGAQHLWNVISKRGKTVVYTTSQLLKNGLKNSAGYKYRVPLCLPVEYKKVDLPIHPYVMGVLLGDGCFRGMNMPPRISCATYDTAIMKKVRQLEPNFIYKRRKTSDNCYEYVIKSVIHHAKNNNRIKITLQKYGLWDKLSKEKFIPEDYLVSSIEDRWHLLQGLMDTDGSGPRSGTARFSTASRKLKNNVIRLVQSLGGMAIEIKTGRNGEYALNIKTLRNPFTLKRKAQYWNCKGMNNPVRSIKSIKLVGQTEQMCISVAAKDNLYLTDNFIVTHNTYLLRKLAETKKDVFFTAPTNKATKVLARATASEAKTTYSQLGIRMQQDDDRLVLTFSKDAPYMPKGSILVVDEASMVGEELLDFIQKVQIKTKCKVLFVGDPAQLPPVGEKFTKAWRVTDENKNRAFMRQIMRFDNQLLTVATKIRENLVEEKFISPIKDDNKDGQGVFLLKSRRKFHEYIDEMLSPLDFYSTKVIAWRNKTVNAYNDRIRENIGFKDPYHAGDILLIAEPVEAYGHIIASIDDEYYVQQVNSSSVRVDVSPNNVCMVNVWEVHVEDDEKQKLILRIAKEQYEVDRILSEKAEAARTAEPGLRRKLWLEFWEVKGLFNKVRYGYAITAHRAQGSTYKNVLIDQHDIMQNPNKREAMRALYVGCTRATQSLYAY